MHPATKNTIFVSILALAGVCIHGGVAGGLYFLVGFVVSVVLIVVVANLE